MSKMYKALKDKSTGSTAISKTFQPPIATRPWKLILISLHLNLAASTSENFIVDIDDNDNAVYDRNLITQDMASVQDLDEDFNGIPREFDAGDKIVITYANSNSKTYGLLIDWCYND